MLIWHKRPRFVRIVTAVESMSPTSAIAGSVRQLPVACSVVGFVVENPAEDVEVVNQHVLEDAARMPDVLDGRRARIAARDDEHFRLADLARIDSALFSAANVGSKRR